QPVTHLDWRDLDETARQWELDRVLDEDRARGLDVATAPLTRLVLARLSATEVRVVWTFHHVLLDGWSVSQVLGDVFAAHAALGDGREPEPATRRPFHDYLHWLSRQDKPLAEEHWRDVLSGFDTPTPLPYDRPPREAHRARSSATVTVELQADGSNRLHE